ncbi:MAG: SMP-30/gluconolactonase/LRE family protein [Alphaproteobacteria bacterium]
MSVECVLDGQADLGEGPVWDPARQLLWWVNITAPSVNRFDPATGQNEAIAVPDLVGALALREQGGLVLALRDGFYGFDPDSGVADLITKPDTGNPGNRFNDGKCDRQGRFWAGTMDHDEKTPSGDLYRLSPDGEVKRFPAGFVVTNGLGWSPDNKTMYFTDSAGRTIYAYDFDLATGEMENRQVFARIEADGGFPDGLTVDGDGFVWGAHWDGWRVTRYVPTGRIERVVDLPVPRVTSCAFGGAGFDILYITSARVGLDGSALAKAPLSGGIFAVQTNAKGLPEPLFVG